MSSLTLDRFCQSILNSELLCPKCHQILSDPYKSIHPELIQCFSCFEDDEELIPQKSLKKKIDEMLIKCKFYPHGCQKILKVDQIGHHEQDDCEYGKLKCDSKECEALSNNGEIKHTPQCGFFIIKCDLCFKTMKLQEKEKHNCIEWLKSVVENLQLKSDILAEEGTNLEKKNNLLKNTFKTETEKLENEIYFMNKELENLCEEEERIQIQIKNEINTSEQQIENRLKNYERNTEYKLKEFYDKGQKEYEKISRLMNESMRNYLNDVNQNMGEFNIVINKENKVLENVTAEEKKLMKQKSPLRNINTPKKKEGSINSLNSSQKKKK